MTRSVPLECSIKITTGMILRSMYPNLNLWQKALVNIYTALERLGGIKIW
jgi:hypothetical protein